MRASNGCRYRRCHGGRLHRRCVRRIRPSRRGAPYEATGLGTAVMFAGVLLIPSSFGVAVAASGGYALAYSTLAVLALGSAGYCSVLALGVAGVHPFD